MKKIIFILTAALLVSVLALSVNAATANDLTFTLNDDGISYNVKAASSDISGSLVIPGVYNKMPVTRIEKNAFYSCSGLTGITIPDSITSVGKDAFFDCPRLTTIINDVSYVGKWVVDCEDTVRNMTIASGTVGISDGVCEKLSWIQFVNAMGQIVSFLSATDNTALVSVSLPEGIKYIGDNAFSRCINLASINIPSSVTGIGEKAFYGCAGLTSIIIPGNVANIEDGAFFNCSNLETVSLSNGLTRISDEAFYGCTELKAISFPASVTSIGKDAFYGCTKLQKYKDNIYYINNWVVSCGESLKNMNVADGTVGISDGVFEKYSYMEITDALGQTVSVLVPVNNTMLTSVSLPTGVKYIGNESFVNCINLTTVNLSNSVISIGDSAFSGCQSLKNINIPDSVTSVGKNAFSDCAKLITTVNGVNYVDGWVVGCEDSVTAMNVLSGTVGISEGVFKKYSWIQYTNASGQTVSVLTPMNNTKLTSISLPDGIKYICNDAFINCINLTNVYFPNSIVKIDRTAFLNCPSLSFSCEKNSVAHAYAIENNIDYVLIQDVSSDLTYSLINGDTEYEVSGIGTCTDEVIIIPSEFDGKPVTGIGIDAFKDCTSITNVIVPNTVTNISNGAFSGCTALDTVTLPDSVSSISSNAFEATSVTIRCNENSYASTYATNNSISLELITYIHGDVDGDGEVTNIDSAMLARYLAGWSGYDSLSLNLDAADVDLDTEVTNIDSAIIARHLAGWTGYGALPLIR